MQWKYCPTEQNLVDLGSRDAAPNKMEDNEWYEQPSWPLGKEDWPLQPNIKCTHKTQEEVKPLKDISDYTREEMPTNTKELGKSSTEDQETDERDKLLS